MYTYDAAGRLTRVDAGLGQSSVYSWTAENRLAAASVTTLSGTTDVIYRYDAAGLMVGCTQNGTETRYLLDTQRAYAEVATESASDGTLLASSTYGLDRISRSTFTGTSYFHTDPSGMFTLAELSFNQLLQNIITLGVIQQSIGLTSRLHGSIEWDDPTYFLSAGIDTGGLTIYDFQTQGSTYTRVYSLVLGETAGGNLVTAGLDKLGKTVAPSPELVFGAIAAQYLGSLNLAEDLTRGNRTMFTPSLFSTGYGALAMFTGAYLSAGVNASSGLIGAANALVINGLAANNVAGLTVTTQGFSHGISITDLTLNLVASFQGNS